MKFNKFISLIGSFVSRVWVAYAAIFFLTICFVDTQNVLGRMSMRRLNDAVIDMGPLVAFTKGEIPSEKMDWKMYMDYFRFILKERPNEGVAMLFLGVAGYYAEGPGDATWAMVRNSADIVPVIFWSVYDAGILAFERGDIRLSIDYLQKALLIPPESIAPAIWRMVLYRQLRSAGKLDLDVMERVTDARENSYLILTAAYFASGEHKKAHDLAVYSIRNTAFKDKEPFYFYAGAASLFLGHPQEALSLLGRSVELGTKNFLAYRYLGEIFRLSGKEQEAQALLKTARLLQGGRADNAFPYPERLRLRVL